MLNKPEPLSVTQLRNELTVCILFFNKLDQTIECIRSVLGAGVRVHVLDNGSDVEAAASLRRTFAANALVTILDAGGNRGVSGGRNLQISDTCGAWLLFLDNDITVATRNWLEHLATWVQRYPNVDVFVPRMFNKHENSWAELADFVVDEAGRCAFGRAASGFANSFPGGASVIRRQVFDELGLYDEDLFVGFEDFELAIRGWKLGRPLLVRGVDEIELIHDHQLSEKVADKEAAIVRYDVSRISNSHAVIQRKHGVLLDPNFTDWLREQVRQLTGDSSQGREEARPPVQHHALSGSTLTPVHTGSASVLVLVPASGSGANLWLRLRALQAARSRAQAAGLRVHLRVLDDALDVTGEDLVRRAMAAGLSDELASTCPGNEATLNLGSLLGFDFVCWNGAGFLGPDFLVRTLQHARFEPAASKGFTHAAQTVLVGPQGQGVRLETEMLDPLVGPCDHRLFAAFVAPASVWAEFHSSRAATWRGKVTDSVFAWLCETAAQGISHTGAPGAVVFIPS